MSRTAISTRCRDDRTILVHTHSGAKSIRVWIIPRDMRPSAIERFNRRGDPACGCTRCDTTLPQQEKASE